MDKTEYTIKLVRIWNSSSNRQEAHERIRETLDTELTYKAMMNKIGYIRHQRGINLRELRRAEGTNWDAVAEAAQY
jgi:hypothetical protein